MTDDTYNGWTNRETWAVMLHINNDQGLQSEAHERLSEVSETHPGETWRAVDALKDWVEDLLTESYWADEFDMPMPFGLTLMRDDVGSLWRVNWRECAESLLSDIEDQS